MSEAMTKLRVALAHDLLVSYGGSEQVLLDLNRMFPEAPIYTTMFDPSRLPARFATLPVRTSFLQNIPSISKNYGAAVPLMPLAFRRFDLRGFDLIISSSHAFAKAVIAPPGALHICYCYTPLRYAWSHQEEYLARVPIRPVLKPIGQLILHQLRKWDYEASRGPNRYIAISETVRQRIAKYYGRESDVVYPAIDISRFAAASSPATSEAAFLVVSRLFPYKRIEVAIEACTRLGLPLKVIGRGPDLRHLRRLAGPTVQFLGEVDDARLETEYRSCRALLFTADEDFGLVPVEAMASGRPVLALRVGGATETVVAGKTGEFYEDGGVDALVEALRRFQPEGYPPAVCRARAEEFSAERFQCGIQAVLERELSRQSRT
jgi:glycosyltransferase involved in cell wall biosynthesis